VLDTTSPAEPSEALKASPYLMECFAHGLPLHECERHLSGAQRLKEAFSCKPFHARAAAKDPDYWNKFYASRVNS
jgi:hypothetical protein